MKDQVNKLLYGVFLVILISGCGTLSNGSTQVIQVTSAPGEATISGNPDIGMFTTPASLELERKSSYTLTVTKEGYEPATARIAKKMKTGTLLLDILLFPIGVIIDGVTGAWYELSPGQVTVVLEQSNPLDEGPDLIEVKFSFDEGKDGLTQIHATSPVQVEVKKD